MGAEGVFGVGGVRGPCGGGGGGDRGGVRRTFDIVPVKRRAKKSDERYVSFFNYVHLFQKFCRKFVITVFVNDFFENLLWLILIGR